MKELSIQDKIQILKGAIEYLKKYEYVGMCPSLTRSMHHYTHRIIIPYSTLDYHYPDFTKDNYMKFYRFNKTVKQCKDCIYWDNHISKSGKTRRIIFLRYLILKLRIQQFKQ